MNNIILLFHVSINRIYPPNVLCILPPIIFLLIMCQVNAKHFATYYTVTMNKISNSLLQSQVALDSVDIYTVYKTQSVRIYGY